MDTTQERESEASRKAILHQFTEDTTFHGVRYMTEKAPILRRVLWIVLVVGCVSGFLAVILTRLLFLLSHPKAVDLQVVYAAKLELPAITICNQNFFRKTKTFEMGYFDRVEDRFYSSNPQELRTDEATCEERFDLEKGRFYGYLLSAQDHLLLGRYEKVSIRVCKELCLRQHDRLCNSFTYIHPTQTCSVSKFTTFSDQLATPSDRIFHPDVDTFIRRRCNGKSMTTCTFEDDNCPLLPTNLDNGRWTLHSGSTHREGTGPRSDHTTGGGHYMYVDASLPTFYNVLRSPFLEATEPICLGLSVSMVGETDNVGSIAIYKSFVDRRQILFRNTSSSKDWVLEFSNIGTGVFQIEIEVTTGDVDIGIDDVNYGPCREFIENCRRDQAGIGYLGNVSVALSGRKCLLWSNVSDEKPISDSDFPDGSIRTAHDYCRNIWRDAQGPWCFTEGYVKEYCNISYCECTGDQYRCDNGMCINRLAVCDGYPDCSGQEDETEGCDASVNCTFEPVSLCGYKNTSTSSAKDRTTWIRYEGVMRNGHLYATDLGHYLYLDSGSVTLEYRQRVGFTSITIPPTSQPSPQCLTLSTYTGRDTIFPDAMGVIRIYQQFDRYEKRPVMLVSGSDNHSWQQLRVSIPAADRETRILIEAAFGRSYYSDMAVDDIALQTEGCFSPRNDCGSSFACRNLTCIDKRLVCDGYDDCVDFADEDWDVCHKELSLSCDFGYRYSCGYKDDSNPDVNGWRWSAEDNTVIVDDNMIGTSTVKRLVSPKFNVSDKLCLRLRLQLEVVSAFCALYIYKEEGERRALLHVSGYNKYLTDTWRWVYGTLLPSPRLGISVEVNCSSEAASIKASMAEIQVTNGSCEDKFSDEQFNCTFTSENMCGYLDISKQGANWAFMPKGQGIVASYWNEHTMRSATAVMLSPEVVTYTPHCLTLDIHSSPSRHSLPLVSIINISQNDTTLWENFTPSGGVIFLLLQAGSYRLKIMASLSPTEEIFLSAITLSHESTCAEICRRQRCNDGNKGQGDGDYDGRMGPELLPSYDIGTKDPTAETTETIPAPSPQDQRTENITNFYTEAGHQSADMFYGCRWAGSSCSAANFTTEITDYGLCHTLNAARHGSEKLQTANTGASSGLQLILNVEQYEYMHGPQPDSGIKMFLYDQGDVPFVRDLGFAVAPGLHGLVAVKLSQTKSLGYPWGTCEQGQLKYGGNYTYSACIREKETTDMLEECACRDAYMPGYNTEDPPICNLTTYLDCIVDHHGAVPSSADVCEEPCIMKVYEAQLSYASLSGLSVSQILNSDIKALQEKLRYALHIRQRSNPQEYVTDISQISQISTSYTEFLAYVKRSGWSRFDSIFKHTEEALHYFIAGIVKPDIEEAFLNTGRLCARTFQKNYGPIIKTIKQQSEEVIVLLEVISRLFDGFINGISQKDDLILQINKATEGLKLLQKAINTNYDALTQNKGVYTTSNISKVDMEFLPQSPILENEASCGELEFKGTLTYAFDDISNLLIQTKNSSFDLNTTHGLDLLGQLTLAGVEFQDVIEYASYCTGQYGQFLLSISVWETNVHELLEKHSSDFTLGEGHRTVDDILDYTDETTPVQEFALSVNALKMYLMDMKQATVEGADLFSENSISGAIQALDKFVSRISLTLIEPLRSKIFNLRKAITDTFLQLLKIDNTFSRYMGSRYNSSRLHQMSIWRRPQAQIFTPKKPLFSNDVFKFQTSELFVTHQAPKVLSELVGWYVRPLEEQLSEFDTGIRNHHTRIKAVLEEVKNRYAVLRKERVIGEDFVRRNFLVLDIFFAQLKYQEIDQIKAYDVGSFFSDVGGFMGLLLGGSIITIFEFIDLIFYKLLLCPGCRSKKDINRIGGGSNGGKDKGVPV